MSYQHVRHPKVLMNMFPQKSRQPNAGYSDFAIIAASNCGAVQRSKETAKNLFVKYFLALLMAGVLILSLPAMAQAKMLHYRCAIMKNNQLNRALLIDFGSDWTLDFWVDEKSKKVLVSGPIIELSYGKPIPATFKKRDANSFVAEWSVFNAPLRKSGASSILEFRALYIKSQKNLTLRSRVSGYSNNGVSLGTCELQ